MIVDAVTGAAVAGGVINGVSAGLAVNEAVAFTLTSEMLQARALRRLQSTEDGRSRVPPPRQRGGHHLARGGVSVELDA